MPRRWKLALGGGIAAVVTASALAVSLSWESLKVAASALRRPEPTIRLGLLHSQTGSLAISEKSLLDAEVLAIEEINATGGIGNRQLVWSAPDCRSDPEVFATEARRLIESENAVALVGCWTSECRKAVIPVVEERRSLLFFPGNYEGIERSERVVYAGGAANQSVLPAVRWAFDTLKSRRFFVVGLEEVWSRCVGEIAKDGIRAAGGELVGESYAVPLAPNVEATVEAIRRAKPDIVLNFLFGDANRAFYSAIQHAGISAEKLPIIAFGVGEEELRRFPPADVVGHYAAWNYFQSVDRPANREFIRRFRERFGEDRVINDPMIAAYNGVKFWSQAAREVKATDIDAVINSLGRQSMDAPDGIVTIDGESRAAWRPFHVGRFRSDGQFEIVWSIDKPIRPVIHVGTRPAESWRSLLESLQARWRGRWSAGASFEPLVVPPTS